MNHKNNIVHVNVRIHTLLATKVNARGRDPFVTVGPPAATPLVMLPVDLLLSLLPLAVAAAAACRTAFLKSLNLVG